MGQLGLGNNKNENSPQLVTALQDIRIEQVSCGGIHSLALSEDGKVYSFGVNMAGQLGLGDNKSQQIPQLVNALQDVRVKHITTGGGFSMVLSDDGRVFSFGMNQGGQLGIGNIKSQNIPQLVTAFQDMRVVQISCGENHSLVLTEEGKVFAFGFNLAGQLGLGNTKNQHLPQLIPNLQDKIVRHISSDRFCSVAITDEGQVYVFGKLGFDDKKLQTVPKLVKSVETILEDEVVEKPEKTKGKGKEEPSPGTKKGKGDKKDTDTPSPGTKKKGKGDKKDTDTLSPGTKKNRIKERRAKKKHQKRKQRLKAKRRKMS